MAATTEMASYASAHIKERMDGFTKDIRICLRPIVHPTTRRPTVAFSPALATCCATLEYLTSLATGRRNGPRVDQIAGFARDYMPQPDYNADVIAVLFEAFRHAVAHRGIVSGVMLHGKSNRRIAWLLADGLSRPAIQITVDAGEDLRAPWHCPHTHRAHIYLRRLASDIRAGGTSYANAVGANARLVQNFAKAMEWIFPRADSSRRRPAALEAATDDTRR